MPSADFIELTGGGRALLKPALVDPAFEIGRTQWDDRIAFQAAAAVSA
ncbi:hypothetical protein GCM10009534_17940 [Kribbella sandramycini]